MKIGFVVDSISHRSGGLFFTLRNLTSNLDKLLPGQVTVNALEDAESANDLGEWTSLRPRVYPSLGPRAIGWAPKLAAALLVEPYDLLHTQGIWQGVSLAVHRWHRATRKPYLISPHGMFDPWALSRSRWKKRISALLFESAHLRDATCIHALCEAEARAIRAYGLKNRIAIIPNGVDLPNIGGRSTEDGGRRKILLFLGRIHPKKGLPNALRAWAEVRGRKSEVRGQDDWQFVIAGWDQGGHEAELKQLCRDMGLSFIEAKISAPHPPTYAKAAASIPSSDLRPPSSVLFVGPAFGPAKEALFCSADAFILPSFSEGLPMSILEAWAYRLPVLMTDHCNLPEGFAANAAIRIGTDVESIAEGLRLLFQSSVSDLRSLGHNGRLLVERQFTWPQVAAQMKEVYEWVLGGGTPPGSVKLR